MNAILPLLASSLLLLASACQQTAAAYPEDTASQTDGPAGESGGGQDPETRRADPQSARTANESESYTMMKSAMADFDLQMSEAAARNLRARYRCDASTGEARTRCLTAVQAEFADTRSAATSMRDAAMVAATNH